VKNEEKLITKLTNANSNINTSNIPNKEYLEAIVQEYARISDFI